MLTGNRVIEENRESIWFGSIFAGGGFGVTRQQPTMMNLFPVEDSSDVKQKNDVFPRQSSFSSSSSSRAKEEVEKIK